MSLSLIYRSLSFSLLATNINEEANQCPFQNKYLRIIVDAPWYASMTLYVMILTYHTLETKLKLGQKYADRKERYSNILAMKEIETTRRLERKLPQDLCI